MEMRTPDGGQEKQSLDFRRMLELMSACLGGDDSDETRDELRKLVALPHVKAKMQLIGQLLGPALPKTNRAKHFVDQVTADTIRCAARAIQTEASNETQRS